MFRIGIKLVVQKRRDPGAASFEPGTFVGIKVGSVTVGGTHESTVLAIDDVLIQKRYVIIEQVGMVPSAQFFERLSPRRPLVVTSSSGGVICFDSFTSPEHPGKPVSAAADAADEKNTRRFINPSLFLCWLYFHSIIQNNLTERTFFQPDM